MNGTKMPVAAVMWTLSLALGMIGTLNSDPSFRFWALMVALPATLVSGHIIVEQVVRSERVRLEHLVDGLIARARARAGAEVTRIR